MIHDIASLGQFRRDLIQMVGWDDARRILTRMDCLGKSVYVVEQECRGKGDKRCRALGIDIDSWGQEIAQDLPYFHTADIQGKIEALTSQLREKELELDRRQRQMEPTGRSRIASVEVRSREFQRVVELAERVAKFDSSVLITGETAVGKEVVARHIHNLSLRSDAPFFAVNCGALPETLLESTLFGHKAGAFATHLRDVGSLYEKGLVSKNDLLAAEVALADAQQKTLETPNKLEVARAAYNRALGRVFTENV